MSKKNVSFDFQNHREPDTGFKLIENIIEDRGSRYSVSFGRVSGKEDIKNFLKKLKQNKRYAKATHNTWAVRISHEGAIYESKADDGEAGAGQIILRLMQKQEVANCIICVTRWFGGVKLMGDRFKHVQDATKLAIDHLYTTDN
jgi:putative IMPACT (imprinted ancient) family translation regulator